jgi:hypothetical protein
LISGIDAGRGVTRQKCDAVLARTLFHA